MLVNKKLIAAILLYIIFILQRSSILSSETLPIMDSSLKGGGGSRIRLQTIEMEDESVDFRREPVSRARTWTQIVIHKPFKTTTARPVSNKCQEAERRLDKCSAQLIGLGSSYGTVLPEDPLTLSAVYCPRFRSLISCVRNNTRCFKPFERQVIK